MIEERSPSRVDPDMAPDTSPMAITVLVVTRNRAKDLERLFDALEVQSIDRRVPWELVVVDNGSTDSTARSCEALGERSAFPVVVRFEGRTGKSRALNMGLAAARGRILALTDDDAIPAPDWLERVLAHFEHQPDTACVGGRVLLHDPADAPITIRLSAEPAVVGLREFSIENIPVLGCNVAFLAATLRSMGGFDTAIGPGSPVGSGDDADMLYRIVCSGFSIRYDPDIIVRHNHGRRTPEAVAQVIEKYQVGRGGFYCKYVIARDRRVLRWAYWELRRLVLTWLAGLGFSDSSRDAARQIRRLAVGAARYWVHGRPARSGATRHEQA